MEVPQRYRFKEIWIPITTERRLDDTETCVTIKTIHNTHASFPVSKEITTTLHDKTFVKMGLVYVNQYDHTALVLLPCPAIETRERWVEVPVPKWGDPTYQHHAMLNPRLMEMQP